MRISSYCVVVLAVLAVSLSGCKVRGHRGGVSAFRSATTRVAASEAIKSRRCSECDCYACRSKRVDQPYVIQSQLPEDATDDSVCCGEFSGNTVEQSIVTDGDVVLPGMNGYGAGNEGVINPAIAPSVDPDVVLAVEPEPVQDIQGEIVTSGEPKNELPEELGEGTTLPDLNQPAQVPSPERVEGQPGEDSPVVPSEDITRPDSDDEPAAKLIEDVMPELSLDRKADAASLKSKVEPSGQPRFSSALLSSGVVKKELNALIRQEVNPAAIASETYEVVEAVSIPESTEPVVLHARPVEQHSIYNGRPTQAPVREACLCPDNSLSVQAQPHSHQVYFQKLPPLSERMPSPAPALSVDAKMAPLPVPALSATTAMSPQPVTARVIRVQEPTILLRAVPTINYDSLPPVASIQLRQRKESFGSVQVLRATTPAARVNQQGLAELKILPLQRTVVQRSDDDRQVEGSIFGLTVRPESSAQAQRQTIER